jgi:hypothetical protein
MTMVRLTTVLFAAEVVMATPGPSSVITAEQNGLWSTPATWGGRLPKPTDDVVIPAGITVIYDMRDDGNKAAEAASLEIKAGGELYVQRTPGSYMRLDLDGSLLNFGKLDIGSPQDPIPASASFELGFNVLRPMSGNDPAHESFIADPLAQAFNDTGLWNYANLTIHGATIPSTWMKLGGTGAPAGATQVTVSGSLAGWKAGDTILFSPTRTPTSGAASVLEDEVATIVSISGNTLTFQPALRFSHVGRTVADPPMTLNSEVALLSRNVRIVSNLPGMGQQSHTLSMPGATTHQMAYAEFRNLGARKILGRYPIHTHQLGNVQKQVIIKGNAVWSDDLQLPTNRSIVIHHTNNADIRDNVAYNAQGALYYLEDADELNNTLVHNLGVRLMEPDELPNSALASQLGYRPGYTAIFWVRSFNNVHNNVAAGGAGEARGFRVSMNTTALNSPDVTTMTGNEAHSVFAISTQEGARVHFDDSLVWNTTIGTQLDTVNGGKFLNSKFIGTAAIACPIPGASTADGNICVP